MKEHQYTKEKLSHRDKQQLSDWRVLKNINDTLKKLQNDPSEEAYKQRCIILASATCPRYGVPQVQETRRVIEEAKQLKRNLFTGAPAMHKKKEVYPVEVHDLALESWLSNSTILEPDKHKRPHTAAKDGNDTIPAHLQIDTDEEAYSKFKDNYEASVKAIMRERNDKIKLKY